MNLSEIVDVSPRRRVTIPEGSVAIIIPQQLVAELKSAAIAVRRGKKLDESDRKAVHGIMGDLLLAILEVEQ